MENKSLIGQVTQEQINSWKAKYGSVFYTTADNRIAYFRKPNRKELSYAMRLQDDPLAMIEMVLKSCCIGGDDTFIKEAEYLMGASALVEKLISVKKTEVGEL